jgi:hypothetical protein
MEHESILEYLAVVKNVSQTHMIDNSLACRARAKALRDSVDRAHSPEVVEKIRAAAQQWDDLAADYESSILKCVS